MGRALRLARRGIYTTDPNPRVGCVIVAEGGTIAGEGWHMRAGEPHAEVHALQAAGARARGATAYVTLEPCVHTGRTPPCTDALRAAGIARVVCAMEDPNPQVAGQGIDSLRAGGIDVSCGLFAAEARSLNRGFVSRMERGRPWVAVKLAVSLDGRTALANGESKWITGEHARADVHRLRAASSAVLSGVGTVLADNPQLTARCSDVPEFLPPLRVIADTQLRTPADAALFQGGGSVRIYHGADRPSAVAALQAAGADLKSCESGGGKICLSAMLEDLAESGINSVLVEAGARLNGALLAAGLVDEVIVYQAAMVMGEGARGMFSLPSVESMADTPRFELAAVRRLGADLRLNYRVL
jgi:diaminohydroxyphosphoribosylaminopyrimidine deaminase/5-amino-6-(5-phosphoribosylamino)uracil reductase